MRRWPSLPSLFLYGVKKRESGEVQLSIHCCFVFFLCFFLIVVVADAAQIVMSLLLHHVRVCVCLDVPLFLGKYLTRGKETWHEPLL